MAAAFANHSLSFAPCRPISAPTSSKPLKTLTLSLPLLQEPSRRRYSAAKTLSSSSSLSRRGRTFFWASLKVAETDPTTVDGDEENRIKKNQRENQVDQSNLPPMKDLVQAYKNAILEGDENSVGELEKAICVVENEKNDLSVRFAEMTAELTFGKDKFLRIKADFENLRKQTEKDHCTFTSDIRGDLIESLLPMVDNFEKTKQQIKPETDKEKKIDTSYQGIYKQFVEIMRSFGVAVVETVGKPFDPAIHEAVAREESQQFKAGIVSQELCRGFVLGDRLLRPATVKVSTGAGQAKADAAVESPTEQPEAAAAPAEDSVSTTSDN